LLINIKLGKNYTMLHEILSQERIGNKIYYSEKLDCMILIIVLKRKAYL
jgi:hypothetical protein